MTDVKETEFSTDESEDSSELDLTSMTEDTDDLSTDEGSHDDHEDEGTTDEEKETDLTQEKKELELIDKKWYKILLTFFYLLVYVGKGFSQMAIATTMSDLISYMNEDYSVDAGTVRMWTLVFRGFGFVASAYPVGKLCELARPKKWYHLNLHHILCVISFAGNCLTLFVIPLILNPYIVLPLNFFWGIGGNNVILVNQILCRVVWEEKRTNAAVYQGFLFSFAFGMFLYSFAVAKIGYGYMEDFTPGERVFYVYYFAAIVQALPFILLILLPSPRNVNPGVDEKGDEAEKKEKKKPFLERFKSMFKTLEKLRVFFIFILAITYVLHMVHIKMFQNLIQLFCEDIGWSKQEGSYATSLFFICYAVSRLMAVGINYFVPSNILVGVYLGGTVVTIFVMMLFQTSNMILWIGFGTVGFFSSPLFAAIAQVPRNYLLELTHVERALMMMPLGLGAAFPGLIGKKMTEDERWYLWSGNGISVLILFTFTVTCVAGYFLKKRYEKKEEVEGGKVDEKELEDV